MMAVTSTPATEEEQFRVVIADRVAAIRDRDAGRFSGWSRTKTTPPRSTWTAPTKQPSTCSLDAPVTVDRGSV